MSSDTDSKQDLAFTPGGPRPRSKVHLLAAHQGPVDDLVIAPGGAKRRRNVHLIKPHQQVLFGAKSAIPLRRRDEPGPPDMANWITCAWFTNVTGRPIKSFVTTWTIPPDPATKGSQLLYLFNGLEPADGQIILQPVLQWGDSGPDEDNVNRTGQFWTVASWLVGGPDNSAHHTPHIRVNPGDVLVGRMSLVSQVSGAFTYTCEFQGLDTMLQTPPMSELVACCQTLEAYELQGQHTAPYDLDSGSEYPAAPSVAFKGINVVTDAAGSPGTWMGQDIVTTYSEHISMAKNSIDDGEVDIYFNNAVA
jgi:hypothetical protein